MEGVECDTVMQSERWTPAAVSTPYTVSLVYGSSVEKGVHHNDCIPPRVRGAVLHNCESIKVACHLFVTCLCQALLQSYASRENQSAKAITLDTCENSSSRVEEPQRHATVAFIRLGGELVDAFDPLALCIEASRILTIWCLSDCSSGDSRTGSGEHQAN
eukprot:5415285-Amphidinium_carterae.1